MLQDLHLGWYRYYTIHIDCQQNSFRLVRGKTKGLPNLEFNCKSIHGLRLLNMLDLDVRMLMGRILQASLLQIRSKLLQ